jgi:hypothetical protein
MAPLTSWCGHMHHPLLRASHASDACSICVGCAHVTRVTNAREARILRICAYRTRADAIWPGHFGRLVYEFDVILTHPLFAALGQAKHQAWRLPWKYSRYWSDGANCEASNFSQYIAPFSQVQPVSLVISDRRRSLSWWPGCGFLPLWSLSLLPQLVRVSRVLLLEVRPYSTESLSNQRFYVKYCS